MSTTLTTRAMLRELRAIDKTGEPSRHRAGNRGRSMSTIAEAQA